MIEDFEYKGFKISPILSESDEFQVSFFIEGKKVIRANIKDAKRAIDTFVFANDNIGKVCYDRYLKSICTIKGYNPSVQHIEVTFGNDTRFAQPNDLVILTEYKVNELKEIQKEIDSKVKNIHTLQKEIDLLKQKLNY